MRRRRIRRYRRRFLVGRWRMLILSRSIWAVVAFIAALSSSRCPLSTKTAAGSSRVIWTTEHILWRMLYGCCVWVWNRTGMRSRHIYLSSVC